jgi:hypothetical protein
MRASSDILGAELIEATTSRVARMIYVDTEEVRPPHANCNELVSGARLHTEIEQGNRNVQLLC